MRECGGFGLASTKVEGGMYIHKELNKIKKKCCCRLSMDFILK